MTTDGGTRMQVALGLSRRRDRELLGSLLADHDVVEFERAVPPETDMCVVDEATYRRSSAAVQTWRDDQHPLFAPVLLLSEADNPWERYADDRGTNLDAIVKIPTPPAAIEGRVDGLLQTRQYSLDLAFENQLTERIFETSPLMKVVLDTDGRVVRTNERFCGVMGVDEDGCTGLPVTELDIDIVDEDGEPIPPAERPARQVLDSGEPIHGVEYAIERPSGDQVWVSVNAAPITNEAGEVEYIIVAMEDITERRAQAEELERRVDLFEKAEDIAKVGAWEYDVEDDELWWTDQVSRTYGLEDDESLSAAAAMRYYNPGHREKLEAAFERAVTEHEPYDLELQLTDAGGTERWVRTRGEPQTEDGEVVRIRGTIQEISDRVEREDELRQMSRAVDAAPIGVTLTDPTLEDNPLTYVNEGFLEMTGYPRDAVIGRNCRFLQGEETSPETVARIRRAIDREEPFSAVIRNYRADGTPFWNSLEIAPIRDERGEVVNFIGFQQDVTDRVHNRRQFQMLDRYLRHNLRNKMNLVQGLGEAIANEAPEEFADYGRDIVETSEQLLENVNKERKITLLLDEDPLPEVQNLSTILDHVLEGIEADYPDATVTADVPESVAVRGTKRLSTALEELCRNALQHTVAGPGRLAVSVAEDDETVTVEIADDGPGIPEMEIDVLREENRETSVYHGEGLGLWMVYLIVQRCGGSIDFKTGPESGTTVRLTLPRGRQV